MPSTIDTAGFFRLYATDRREESIASFVREDLGVVVRYTPTAPGMGGMVMFAELDEDRVDACIADQVAYFRGIGRAFEWKVYAFDRPGDLRERLIRHGFMADDDETFMVFPLTATQPLPSTPACIVRRIATEAGMDDVMAVQRAVRGHDIDWLAAPLARRLRDEPRALSIWCAYRDGRPVGCGWTDYPAGSRFPELHGGAVVAKARGLGIYSALFRARLHEAAQRGHAQLCVDASSMSRPILEHIGFVPICATVPMRHRV